jgi:DNA polymerase III epsilon subunit family exonuclease
MPGGCAVENPDRAHQVGARRRARWKLPRLRLDSGRMFDASAPIGSCTFVAFDTETTGKGPGARLVEIAATRFRGDQPLGTFQTLVDPGMPIPAESFAVHNIGDEMVLGQPKAPEALRAFFAFCADSVLVAHNAEFDLSVIGLELTRHGLPAPSNAVLDSLKGTRRLYPSASHSLDALIETLGLPRQEARHRALGDAELVRHLVRKLCEGLGGDAKPIGALAEIAGEADTLERYLLPAPPLAFAHQLLDKACRDRSKVQLHLDAGGAKTQTRIVSPRLIYDWKGTTFLEAFCPEDGVTRCFQLERIAAVKPGASSGFLF